MSDPLFRREAIDHQRQRLLGEIVVARSVPATALTAWFVLLTLGFVVLFFTAGFTRKETVPGVVMPDVGLLRITASQPGTVAEVRVRLGDEVAAGDVLVVVATGHESRAGDTQHAVGESLRRRIAQLEAEQAQQQRQTQGRQSTLELEQGTLAAELTQYDEEIKLQTQRTELARVQAQRFAQLRGSLAVTDAEIEERQSEALLQQRQLQALQRSRLDALRTLQQTRATRSDEPLRAGRESSTLGRELLALKQQLAESEGLRHRVVRAPQAGRVTALGVEPGRTVEAGSTLAALMPAGSRLEAELYAPTRAIGFVQPGTTVLLRLDAYPYAKFGAQHGTVREVSRSALPLGEWGAALAGAAGAAGEPVYRIRVRLDTEQVMAFGRPHELKPGMQLQASLLLEHRRLSEWVLEPLTSLRERL